MTTRIYTKTGDDGDTGLFGGRRVAKDDVRVETYGTVDELNATIGLALAFGDMPELVTIQSLLFELGAELATPPEREKRRSMGVSEADVTWLERAIDTAEAQLPELKSFILPGGTQLAAALHVARNVCRRAERLCVRLRREDPLTSVLTVVFLNRLSDLLFVYARLANHQAGRGDVAWRPR
jgi:cob(I)alamin adenosyltransferase